MGIFDFLKKSILEDDDYYEDDGQKSFKKEVKYKEHIKNEEEPSKEDDEKFVENQILMVIRNHNSLDSLKKSADTAAFKIGESRVELVPKFLEWKILRPDDLKDNYTDIDNWEMVVENAVLTILYSFKDKGVFYLTEIMKNNRNYRMKAIKLLCDIAVEGFSVEVIIEEVGKLIDYLGKDDRIKVFSYLGNIKMNTTVIGVIQFYYQEFLIEGDVQYAYLALVQLINVAENCTKSHLEFLRMLASGHVNIDLGTKIVSEDVDYKLSVKAALTYYLLKPDDKEIYKLIKKYEFECDDRELLMEIDEIIN